MKKKLILFYLIILSEFVYSQVLNENIYVNQEGYNVGHTKSCLIRGNHLGEKFFIVHAGTRERLYSSTIKEVKYYSPDQDSFSIAYFSDFNKKGEYFLALSSMGRSYSFSINDDIYKAPFLASLKSFYYQRASMKIDKKFGGVYFRDLGHPDTALHFIEVKGKIKDDTWNAPKGWYDAGDYGKYIVNGGVSVGTLMDLYEFMPNVVGDSLLNIPESGNGMSDLLDEIKYELDWFMSMQDSDGGVFFKIGGKKWPGMVMPAQDKLQRYIIGKSTSSTLNFCAAMAMAARIYKNINPKFAEESKKASIKAWKWAKKNPFVAEPDNTEGSGPYRDNEYSDEFFWAATELYITSGDNQYLGEVEKMFPIKREVWWQDVSNLAYYSIFNNMDKFSKEINSYVDSNFSYISEQLIKEVKINGFRGDMFFDDFHWGSNGALFNKMIIPLMWYKKTKDSVLLNSIIESVDYIFGKNATAFSMITGFGKKKVMTLHHRQSQGDDVYEPVPGLITGGPNSNLNGIGKALTKIICKPTPPAECFAPIAQSWGSNEPAINQIAPAVFVFGALNRFVGK